MPRTPRYCRYRTDFARVTINGKTTHLGRYDDQEAVAEYKQLIAEWASGPKVEPVTEDEAITVAEVLAGYLDYAKSYHGESSTRYGNIRRAIRTVNEIYAGTPAADFGPKKLKAVRQVFIDRGNCRRNVNDNTRDVLAIFRWAAEEELIPGSALHSLQAVRSLRKGKHDIREGKPVTIVAQSDVDAVLDELTATLTDMVRLQLLTGMRPGEVCQLSPGEVDRSGDVWLYEPEHHKTSHLDHKRVVAIGPKAQDILRKYLLRGDGSPCFSPVETSHNAKTVGDQYTAHSYRRAIHRACDRAKIDRWSPNRLRHTRATEVREQYGLDAVQAVLGHKHARISEVYGELNTAKAVKIAQAIG